MNLINYNKNIKCQIPNKSKDAVRRRLDLLSYNFGGGSRVKCL